MSLNQNGHNMNNTHETTVTLETLKRAEKYINNDYTSLAVTVGQYSNGVTLLFINGQEVMEARCSTEYPAMLHMMYVITNIVEEIPAVRRRKRK